MVTGGGDEMHPSLQDMENYELGRTSDLQNKEMPNPLGRHACHAYFTDLMFNACESSRERKHTTFFSCRGQQEIEQMVAFSENCHKTQGPKKGRNEMLL